MTILSVKREPHQKKTDFILKTAPEGKENINYHRSFPRSKSVFQNGFTLMEIPLLLIQDLYTEFEPGQTLNN